MELNGPKNRRPLVSISEIASSFSAMRAAKRLQPILLFSKNWEKLAQKEVGHSVNAIRDLDPAD